MKPLITGVAFIILMMFFNVFQVEQDTYIRAQEHVKILCNDMAAAGVLFISEDAYALGNKEFNVSESEGILRQLIQMNMDLDEELNPLNESYWNGSIQYKTYYFDDSGFMTCNMNGEFVEMNEVEILNNFPNTHGLNFTKKDLQKFVDDTNEVIKEGWVKPNIKVSHSDQQLLLREMFDMQDVEAYEELPNLGLMNNLKFKEDNKGLKVVADFKQIPKTMKELISS